MSMHDDICKVLLSEEEIKKMFTVIREEKQ